MCMTNLYLGFVGCFEFPGLVIMLIAFRVCCWVCVLVLVSLLVFALCCMLTLSVVTFRDSLLFLIMLLVEGWFDCFMDVGCA